MPTVLVLVDGEHYPPVVRWGLAVARERGLDPVAALLVGGGEKLSAGGEMDLGDLTVERAGEPGGRAGALAAALDRHRPEAVLDLSDEPVLGYRERLELVAVALARGVPYLGADFRFEPPPALGPLPVPAIAVIGTGKRTGKTAIGGHVARAAASRGLTPVVVAMGRGGPEAPEVAHGPIGLDELRALVREGRHAASDYLEDAVTAGVTTVGARRIGGGLAGASFATNAAEAADVAVSLGAGIVVLEGSGSALPPVAWDAAVLVAPASLDPEFLRGYLGPYRILRSDLFVLTMGSGPDVGPKTLAALESHIRRLRPDAWFVVTDFVPTPLGDVEGKRVFLATTASAAGAHAQAAHLQASHGADVIATGDLADRAALRAAIDGADAFDVLATELKAAAVDVASELALQRGAEVVFVDNRAVTLSGDGELEDLLGEALSLAAERAEQRDSG